MCDYSLEAYRSQPALEGERYVLDRFPSGCKGFTTEPFSLTAVCMPAGAKLRIEGIAPEVQVEHGVGPIELVTVTRLDMGPFRDALVFANGAAVILPRLNTGLRATVLSLPEKTFEVVEQIKRDIEALEPVA